MSCSFLLIVEVRQSLTTSRAEADQFARWSVVNKNNGFCLRFAQADTPCFFDNSKNWSVWSGYTLLRSTNSLWLREQMMDVSYSLPCDLWIDMA